MAANIRAGRAFVEMTLDGHNKFKSDLARSGARLKKFGQTAKSVGKNLLAMGTAAAVPLALSAKTFAEFDDKMRAVKAITGSTTEDFAKLTAEAKRLGATTRFSASEAAEGMRFLGMAGFNTEQIMKGLPAVLDLAAAGAVELGMAADIVSDVGSAFGLTADEAGRVSDVIAQTASSANTSIEMMGESFKYVAPIAKAAGQTLEETSAAIGLLGNSGIKASSAGTQLTEIMSSMGGKSAKALEKMGIATKNADGSSRRLLDVMTELGAATRGMDPLDRLNTMMDLFGKRGGRAAIVLADAGRATDQMRVKMDTANGRAKAMADTMEGGIGGAFRQMKAAVEGAGIAMGKALVPMLLLVTELTKKVALWFEENAGVAKILVVVSAGLLATGAVLVTFGSLLTIAGAAATAFSTAMAVMGGVVAFLMSPIGLLIALIATLTAGLLYFSNAGKKVRTMFGGGAKSTELKSDKHKEDALDQQREVAAAEAKSAELRLQSAAMLKSAISAEGDERVKKRRAEKGRMDESNFDDVNSNLGQNLSASSPRGTFSSIQAARMSRGTMPEMVKVAEETEKMRKLLEAAKRAKEVIRFG
jgi:TP901 family phage tail tape measure protein